MNCKLLYLAIRELTSKKTICVKRELMAEIKNKKDRRDFEIGFNKGFIRSFIKARSK